MCFSLVEDQCTAVEDLFVQLPDVMLGIVKRPEGGIGQVLVPAVDTGLFTLAVCTVGHAGLCFDLTAENISAAQSNRIPRKKGGVGYPAKRFPCTLGITAVVLIIAVRVDVKYASRGDDAVGCVADLLLSVLAKGLVSLQKFGRCLNHILSSVPITSIRNILPHNAQKVNPKTGNEERKRAMV